MKRLEISKAKLKEQFALSGIVCDPILTHSAEELISHSAVDIIIITTPTHLHRENAVMELRSGKKVYLDKPLAQTAEDAVAIVETSAETGNPLVTGFARRYEAPWRKLFSLLEEGAIGNLKMMQVRAVIPYWHYFQTWHRRREWSGGGLMDKSSHHCDVFNGFARDHVFQANAFGGRSVFLPREDAPLGCRECTDLECPYRVKWTQPKSQDEMTSSEPYAFDEEQKEMHRKDNCVYRPGSDCIDHASIHFAYANGVVAHLWYAIFCPRAEDEETFPEFNISVKRARKPL